MRCPSAADVAPTPLMRAPPTGTADRERCTGLAVPHATSSSGSGTLGALITVTNDKMNAEATLLNLMATDSAIDLREVVVTIDFKDKSEAAAASRREWARSNTHELQRMAQAIRVASGGVPVLVELIDMNSCMGRHLSRVAFRNYAGSGCGVGASTCSTSRMWKNTVAFSWGLARMEACVRYVVHVDNDIRLLPHRPLPGVHHRHIASSFSWVGRAIGVLQASDTVLSVHPLRGRGPSCGASQHDNHESRCKCRIGRDPTSGGLYMVKATAVTMPNSSAAGCLLTYEGLHKPGVPHFSIQAFVLDLQRFNRLWPLTPYRHFNYGPYNSNGSVTDAMHARYLQRIELRRSIRRHEGHVDPESMFEENALEQGLNVVYMRASELGVEKALYRKSGG